MNDQLPRTLLVCVALVLAAGCASTVDYHTCESCGKDIRGEYVTDYIAYYHPEHFVCGYCKRPIGEEAYLLEGGAPFHSACYRTQFMKCAYCNDPEKEGTFVSWEDKTYHDSCLREIVVCVYCGDKTKDLTFVEYEGEYYHRSCLREHVLACDFCNNPIRGDSYTSYEGRNYHVFCFKEHIAVRCTLCREPITDEYIPDYWGGTYHTWHEDEAAGCGFCGRLMWKDNLEGGIHYEGDWYLCSWCRKSSVVNVGQADELIGEVADQLRRSGIDVNDRTVAVRLVEFDELKRLSTNRSHRLRGMTRYQVSVDASGTTRYTEMEVLLLRGMPRVQMTGTIAHELMHVWQIRHIRKKTYLTLSEGSCNYAAYLVLKEMPGEQSKFMIQKLQEDKDRVYGGGFRRVKRYAEENGTAAWLSLLKDNGRLPEY